MNPNDPAFPFIDTGNPTGPVALQRGVSKRELATMLAMQGLIRALQDSDSGVLYAQSDDVARLSVEAADALLDELSKPRKEQP